MKYTKASVSFIAFDNSDVVFTGSGNCGHQTSGMSCKKGNGNFEGCLAVNHQNKPAETYGPAQL